jgi:hypothetical protein
MRPEGRGAIVNAPRITINVLYYVAACRSQRDLFYTMFPDGVEVSVEAAIAVADKFDWHWAAIHLLSPDAYGEFNTAQSAAEGIRANAMPHFEDPDYGVKARNLYVAYDKAVATAFAEAVLRYGLRPSYRAMFYSG